MDLPTCGILKDFPVYTTLEPPCYGRRVKFCAAYTIFHPATRKVYVGSTSDLYRRKHQHVFLLRKKSHPNARLQEAYNFDDELVFEYSLTNFSVKQAQDIEQLILDQYFDFNILFNYGRNALYPTRGIKKTSDQIKEIRALKTGIKLNLSSEALESRRVSVEKINEISRKPIIINSVEYSSIFSASEELGIPKSTIRHRVRSLNFDTWTYR